LVLLRPSEPDAPLPSASQTGLAETVEPPQAAAIESVPHVEEPQAPRMATQRARLSGPINRVGMPSDPLPAIEPIAIEPLASIERVVLERIPEPMPLRIDSLRVEPLVFQ
jgi:hypothetical protein